MEINRYLLGIACIISKKFLRLFQKNILNIYIKYTVRNEKNTISIFAYTRPQPKKEKKRDYFELQLHTKF